MKKKSFEELAEEFTIQGFFMVSLWAFFMFIIAGGYIIPVVLKEFKIIKSASWKSYILTYAAIWFFVFLVFCLIPKLRGKK